MDFEAPLIPGEVDDKFINNFLDLIHEHPCLHKKTNKVTDDLRMARTQALEQIALDLKEDVTITEQRWAAFLKKYIKEVLNIMNESLEHSSGSDVTKRPKWTFFDRMDNLLNVNDSPGSNVSDDSSNHLPVEPQSKRRKVMETLLVGFLKKLINAACVSENKGNGFLEYSVDTNDKDSDELFGQLVFVRLCQMSPTSAAKARREIRDALNLPDRK